MQTNQNDKTTNEQTNELKTNEQCKETMTAQTRKAIFDSFKMDDSQEWIQLESDIHFYRERIVRELDLRDLCEGEIYLIEDTSVKLICVAALEELREDKASFVILERFRGYYPYVHYHINAESELDCIRIRSARMNYLWSEQSRKLTITGGCTI